MIQKALFSSSPSPSIPSFGLSKELYLILETPLEGFIRRRGNYGTCGQYSLKAVIEGKLPTSKPMKAYSAGWRSRMTYLMSPRAIRKVLKKHGLTSRVLRAKRCSFEEKLALLQQELKYGPLILLIGNGFTTTSYFSRRKAIIHRHYITLWGYNDQEGVFYVYDSNTLRPGDNNMLLGTLKIPYQYIIKGRSRGASKLLSNYAIAVQY